MESNGGDPDKVGGFSFSFSKKKEQKQLKEAAFKDTDTIAKDDTEFIESSEGLGAARYVFHFLYER